MKIYKLNQNEKKQSVRNGGGDKSALLREILLLFQLVLRYNLP
jgi:hypothetical protein